VPNLLKEKENAEANTSFTTKSLQIDVAMSMNGDTSVCKGYVVKFVVSLTSLKRKTYVS
jgi:hypothetical protein